MSSEEKIMWTGKQGDERVSLKYHKIFISSKKITQNKKYVFKNLVHHHQFYKTKYTKYFLISQ